MRLVVRCFAEQSGNQWQAFSLEFGLAAQAESLAAVKVKLEGQIEDYLRDALCGQDREYAPQLLSRRAPIFVYAKYYLFAIRERLLRLAPDHDHVIFAEPMCLAPLHQCVR